jgi:hypothetical protein
MLLSTATLLLYELVAYSRARTLFPQGETIAGVPVSGMTAEEASQLLNQVYNQPIETHINESVFYIVPAETGFNLDIDSMLAAADAYRTQYPFWDGFWNYLWNNSSEDFAVPLKAGYSPTQLKALLADLAARYDLPPIPPQPQPGTPFFTAGQPGVVLNQEQSAELLKNALFSANQRRITLPITTNERSLPTLQTLETLIKQIAMVNEFNGLMDMYMVNLQDGQDLHIVRDNNQDLSKEPDIAFSAQSVIKIGIMLTIYRDANGPLDDETSGWMQDMIQLSSNDQSDLLMQKLDRTLGPLRVTDTLAALGLQNTFIAGYFYDNAPLLKVFSTPANRRTDIDTNPDPYNQTTPMDIGLLLEDLYQCSLGGGTLLLLFPDQITPQKCDDMINLLSQDRIGVLIQGGVPEGTKVAHKHGWIVDSTGTVVNYSDAGIVYTPGGNFVLSVFLWQKEGLLWDQGSKTIADIAKAVYNYFNPPVS